MTEFFYNGMCHKMPDTNSTNDNTLLIQMIQALAVKVDSLPTRHEFDSLNGRFDGLENKIDKYVLKSEFDTYKEFADQRLQTLTKALDDKLASHVKDDDERHTKTEATLDTLTAGRIPQWLSTAIVSAIFSIIVGVILHFVVPANVVQTVSNSPAQIQSQGHR